jgi:hypothetical protein
VVLHIPLSIEVSLVGLSGAESSNQVPDCLRVACDLMVLFYIFDEFTDKVDGNGARAYAELVVDVLRNPHMERPRGESKLGEITQQCVSKIYASSGRN